MSRVEFVEQSRGPGIGASLAAACLGVSPYKSRIGAWMTIKGRARDAAGPQAEWGNILEPVIRGYYAARHGITIEVPTESVHHPLLPWLRCTPDGIISPRRGLQCKNVDAHLSWQWGLASSRTPPQHYRIQAIVEMAVMGWDRDDFAVLLGGNSYFECVVERDLDIEADIIERLVAFWTLIETNTPPPIDDADEWRDYFADRLPREPVKLPADAATLTLVDEWKDLRATAKSTKAAEAELKNRILAAAVRDGATKFETQHGDVLIVQPTGGSPYVKAPASWGEEKAT